MKEIKVKYKPRRRCIKKTYQKQDKTDTEMNTNMKMKTKDIVLYNDENDDNVCLSYETINHLIETIDLLESRLTHLEQVINSPDLPDELS